MNKLFKRINSVLLALFIVLSLLPMPISAAHTIVTTPTGYTSASDVVYVKDGKYVANWGARGEVCVFLSTYAQNFYTGSNTFDALSALTGGSSQSNAPQSALYAALQNFMTSKHSYQTSYDATKDLYCYTDCVLGDYSKLSSFYSGKMVASAWSSGGKTWNREHTWPNSKGLGGNDENDIMMLRPTIPTENGSRGNKAYGTGSGCFDPGVDVRGDVARIFLYVYTRWGNTNGNGQYTAWGSSGVIQSLDLLLDWMEEDPVDTWEMGRNDAVQSITGTRNVFVDYPEFAWLMFGQNVPAGITTPSDNDGMTANPGGNTGGSGNDGNTGNNGSSSGGSETTTTVNWVSAPQAGTAYKFGLYQQTNGETVYFNGQLHSTPYYLGTTKDYNNAVDIYLESVNGGYKIYFNDGNAKKYIKVYQSGEHTNAGIADGSTDTVFTWDATKKAFITELGGKQFYLGTYSYYSSIGASAIDKLNGSYTAQLCTTGTSTGGNSSGSTGNTGNTGNTNTATPPVTQPPVSQPNTSEGTQTSTPAPQPGTSEGTQTSTPATQPGQPAPLPMASVNPNDFIVKNKDAAPSVGTIIAIIVAILAAGIIIYFVVIYFVVIKPKKNAPVAEVTPEDAIPEETPADEVSEEAPTEEPTEDTPNDTEENNE